jgi:acyl-CoA synthetase (AMP-forming)/AMP-acid ligase II
MIHELLRDVARKEHRGLAIIDGDQRLTFDELYARVQGAREWLRRTLDLKPGDVIALSLDNSWQFVACSFAVSELGGVMAPCNPQWRAAELRSLATRLNFRGAVIESRFAPEWNQILDVLPKDSLVTADDTPAGPASGSASGVSPALALPDAPAFYLFTSGSTGTPRVAPRSHRNLGASAENVGSTLDIGPGRRFLSVVPFFSSQGFHNGFLVPLLRGATLVMMRQFSAGACAELTHRENVNTIFGSPFIYGYLMSGNLEARLLASLQYCYCGGARLPSNVAERWRERCGTAIRQSYGMCETGLISAERSAQNLESSVGACIGEAVGNVEVAILGGAGENLEAGEIGELAVRSDSLMSGYVGEPDLNLSRFHNGFFRTGDLACLDDTGRIHLTGRMGRGINIAGTKIDPIEVERVVEMLPNVASCHVDAVPNARGGDFLRARVVSRQGLPVTRREVIEHCRRHLTEYKLPRVIEFLETSPATLAGKIVKARGGNS